MTFDQAAILTILVAMLVAYATERVRVELVAMSGLAIGYALGIVPVQRVFSGFASPAVITVIEVLLVVGVLARTRIMDGLARRITAFAHSEWLVILLLGTIGAAVSVFMNNIGALALVFPVAMSVCARLSIAPAKILMALSFATLLGGMCSLTGTPANLVVNEWVIAETGRSLGYFELGVLGGPLTLAGLLMLALLAPRVFKRFREAEGEEADSTASSFLFERIVSENSSLAGLIVPEAEERFDIELHAVLRKGRHVFARRHELVIAAGDTLLLGAPLGTVQDLEANGTVEAEAGGGLADPATMEFVVMPDSLLLGSRVEDIAAYAHGEVQVLALSSRRGRIEGRFSDLQLSMGDLVVMAGEREELRRLALDCGLLALSPRRNARPARHAARAAAVFALGVLATAFGLAPTEIAFGAVVLAMVVMGQLNIRNALQDLNWPIVVLLACMIPLGMAVEDTGAARVLADGIAGWLSTGEPLVVVLVVLILATAITPFIDNVSTAVVISPIAAGLAVRTGTPVEPLLMAVAIGASLDFLTPFGHHNNAVVMGAGGYRFMDFPRLGLPLTILCLVLATGVFAVMLGQ